MSTRPNRLKRSCRLACTATLIVGVSALATHARGADYTCAVSGDERHLRLDIPGEQHLCEVSVTNGESERRVLWYADNDTMFCTDRTEELVAKYTDQWGFTCSLWPADDDMASLDRSQRRRLDRFLQERRSRPDGGPDAIRVAQGTAQVDGSSVIAVQWLESDARSDSLSVFLDSGQGATVADWESIAFIENLSDVISPGVAITRSLLKRIDDSGAIVLSTVLDSSSTPVEAPPCRGEQRFFVSDQGSLNALTPHIYSCDTDVATR